MTSNTYHVCSYTESFREQILELQAHHWSTNAERNAAYLQWKYYENPYLDEPCIAIALERGRVVGMRGMYGARWQSGNPAESFVGPCAGDIVIHPDHRGRGLFDRLTACAEADLVRRGYRFGFNLSSSATTYVNCLKLGWKGIGPLGQVERQPGPAGRIAAVLRCPRRGHSTGDPRPEAMARLAERTSRDGRIRQVRDATFWSWRLRNPFSRYLCLFEPSRPKDDLRGFLVLQHTPDEPRVLRIVDWEARDDGVRKRLLDRALRNEPEARMQTWSACLPGTAQRLLRARGFRKATEPGFLGRARPTVLVHQLEPTRDKRDEPPDLEIPLDCNRWDMRMVFSDAY